MRASIVPGWRRLIPSSAKYWHVFRTVGYEPATLEDVGSEIGLTRERVRQIQVEGLRRLREILLGQGLSIEALFRTN